MNALALLVTLTALASTGAEEDCGGSFLLAPKVGVFKSTTALSSDLYFGAEVGYLTPLLERRLAVTLEVNYHRPRITGSLSDPQFGGFGAPPPDGAYSLAVREVAFLLSAVFRFEQGLGPLTPYVGGGPGLYLHRATADIFGTVASESDGGFGLQALAGLELPLGPGGAFFEAHYHFAPVDLVTTGDVNVGGFLASVGYRLRL
ncbi:outer membrane beta-barrel protein [Pyxidicoccus fallax]|uniref:Outer membrane beta-barrel protein n=1 Tax=Pyxidicoccus fallax TaxID=394095 RepID=A0A848LI31_9BACT|nr:outer membrane beta-barrel protein [Pyxidicoccus fallax]NMO17198.1 outer membrane beta-barrel protein [Pyxidicoccus fallax]NPC80482.1 outer membrane beta-barrel protein [Pyxidicoccus fallax]